MNEITAKYEQALIACLGALSANAVVTSKESTKTVRDASKHLDSLSVQLRKDLIEFDKSLVIKV